LMRFSARAITNSDTVRSERFRWLLNSEAIREIRLRDWRRWTGVRSLSFMVVCVCSVVVSGRLCEVVVVCWGLS
jgi:hypothetical protein